MKNTPGLISLILLLALPATALSEDAQSILQMVKEKKAERMANVRNYTVDQSMNGIRSLIYFERFAASDGMSAFRMVPLPEIARRQSEEAGEPVYSEQQIAEMAEAVRLNKDRIAMALSQGMNQSGLPLGSIPGADPHAMMDQYSEFLDAGAAPQGDGKPEALDAISDMAEFAEMARLVGRETIDGREAFLLRAGELNRELDGGDGQFMLQTVSLWIDSEKYVPLRLKMDGVAKSGKESLPMTIEKLDQGYESIDGSSMYESRRQVMRLAGILTPKQEREIKEAQAKLAEFKIQMNQMPEGQRDMIMRRMGPQMEMMERMASGGGIEVVTVVHEIRVNAGLPDRVEMVEKATDILGTAP